MKKKLAKAAISNAATVTCPEQDLALAVVLKAIDDVGRKIDKCHNDKNIDSRVSIVQGGLNFWLQSINVDIPFFHLTLKRNGIIV